MTTLDPWEGTRLGTPGHDHGSKLATRLMGVRDGILNDPRKCKFDPVSIQCTVNYYEDVIHPVGRANADSFVRPHMVPGMQHCIGGPGTDVFGQSPHTWTSENPRQNVQIALENWAEKGDRTPVPISATGAVQGQRRSKS